MPVTATVAESVTEQVSVTKNVSITPVWEITDINISSAKAVLIVTVNKGYFNIDNIFVTIARQNFTISGTDFLTMAQTVISGQTFYTAMKTILYDYLISKGYIGGTVS